MKEKILNFIKLAVLLDLCLLVGLLMMDSFQKLLTVSTVNTRN